MTIYQARLRKLVSRLKGPAYLFTDKIDIAYLTGIDLDGFWLLASKKGPAVFAPRMLEGQIRAAGPRLEVISGDSLIELLAAYLKRAGIPRLGMNGAKSSHTLFNKISCKIKLINEDSPVTALRMVKDDEELACIRKACAITTSALRHVRRFIKPGISEIEIAFKIEEYFAKHQARPAFPLIVACGPNSANPHHISSTRKIKPNDVILLDIGCVYKGYCSDLTRTFFLGKINSLQQKVYAVVKKAQVSALRRLKPGLRADTADRAARQIIKKAGFGDKFIHTTGHGVGMDIHEPPRLSAKDKTVLRTGMVITVEPGIYLEGGFGVRIEDTAVVTNKGREVLTK